MLLFSIFAVILGVGLLILVHEFGHFIVAKWKGVRVEIFSIFVGPVLLKKRYGQTEYRLCLIPLGGYVKLAGEHPYIGRTGASYELCSKTPFQRFQIFVAGALMNILLAFPLCVATYLIGKNVFEPVVGMPGTAEVEAGIRPGDRILSVDGVKIDNIDTYRLEVLRKPNGSIINVKVLRDGKQREFKLVQSGSERHATLPPSNQITEVKEGSVAYNAGFKVGDRILKINGKPTYFMGQIEQIVKNSPNRDLCFTVLRGKKTIKIRCRIGAKEKFEIPEQEVLDVCQAVVGSVVKGNPAYGKLMPGDKIRSVDGTYVNSWKHLRELIKGKAMQEVNLEVMRNGSYLKFKIIPNINLKGEGVIGITMGKSKTFTNVKEGSYFYRCGIRDGDEILRIEDSEVDSIDALIGYNVAGKKEILIHVKRGAKIHEIKLPVVKKVYGDVGGFGIHLFVNMFFKRWGFLEAVSIGVSEPLNMLVITCQILYKLISAQESLENLAGPVGIFAIAKKSAEIGLGNFLWLLAFITVNLGILNLLPIPILDGGLILLLIIEKIRGKPPGEKFLFVYQLIGIAFLVVLIAFVTYRDIVRFIIGGQ
jgi:regulator of sigma E protease